MKTQAVNPGPLTRRQIEVMTCIHLREHLYGNARFIDLVGDIGISSNTLVDHLDALAKREMIPPSPYKKRKTREPTYRYKNSAGIIELTDLGKKNVQHVMGELNISINDPLISALSKIRDAQHIDTHQGTISEKKPSNLLRRARKSEFSDAFNKLMQLQVNKTEPVISCIGMYTELDSQLGLLKTEDNETYLKLSKTKLNLPIRNGRIASLVIPVTLRQQMTVGQMATILERSWRWFDTVNDNTINRYVNESKAMGLIEMNAGLMKSCKPSTSGTMEWLSTKTLPTFLNALPNIPKAAIMTFRESFVYPTREDFLNPSRSGTDLEWAEQIYTEMNNKSIYKEIISDTLRIMVDQAKIMIEDPESNRIVPRTILRRLNEGKDLYEAFHRLLGLADENPTAALLLIITAQPGITMDELYARMRRDKQIDIKYEELNSAVDQMTKKGLIHTASGVYKRLWAFTQVPYVTQTGSSRKNEINAILKGINPSLLAKIEETMVEEVEKQALQNILERLTQKKMVEFDSLENEYGKGFSRKLIRLSDYLSPFVIIDQDFTGLKVANEQLSSIVLDITRYSILAGNDALGEYATLLSDLVRKDTDFKSQLLQSTESIEAEFLDRGMKMS